jgi:hypothetical protein
LPKSKENFAPKSVPAVPPGWETSLQNIQLTQVPLESFELMSGLVMVTDAPVLMVMRHGLLKTQALVFRLLTQPTEGVEMVMPAVPCSHRLLFIS